MRRSSSSLIDGTVLDGGVTVILVLQESISLVCEDISSGLLENVNAPNSFTEAHIVHSIYYIMLLLYIYFIVCLEREKERKREIKRERDKQTNKVRMRDKERNKEIK